ncbi:unnamed protein product [Caenorhabditis angaria]|uniref:Uncharacterized protein n=1 Tax=Caenorhabditis angaria TaxID=860376 RepID=A0A9P1N5A2_9PELO|nr:unnamed protein product [Caenorhabditis angaria]
MNISLIKILQCFSLFFISPIFCTNITYNQAVDTALNQVFGPPPPVENDKASRVLFAMETDINLKSERRVKNHLAPGFRNAGRNKEVQDSSEFYKAKVENRPLSIDRSSVKETINPLTGQSFIECVETDKFGSYSASYIAEKGANGLLKLTSGVEYHFSDTNTPGTSRSSFDPSSLSQPSTSSGLFPGRGRG